MQVRAKCRVTKKIESSSINPHASETPQVEVTLQPVFATEDGDANANWSKYTPSGELRLTITNPTASDAFVVGKAYFVDFTPVD